MTSPEFSPIENSGKFKILVSSRFWPVQDFDQFRILIEELGRETWFHLVVFFRWFFFGAL